jgi:hypothetical protein
MTTEEGNVDSLEGRMTTAEGDIDDIEDGTTIVPKALADQNGNVINTTYLTQSSATATYIPLSQKGVANGVTPLGSNGKVPSIYLSGEQDDLAEFADLASFPAVGETDILYVALDTNKLYRWSGSAYVVISETLAIGTTNTTAFAGDRGLALETLTDNIVDGSQTLALKDQVIRNTVVGTSPLVVNSIASTTANLTEFQVNGTKVLEVTPVGGLNQNGTRLFSQRGNATTNNFLGINSGGSATTGGFNTSMGSISMQSIATGAINTAIGYASLNALTSGSQNTSIGADSGRSITSGSTNTFIGANAGFNASQLATATNSTALGNGSFTDKSNQMVFGNASVSEILLSRNLSGIKVGIGTTTPALNNFGNEFTISGSSYTAEPEGFLNLQGTRTIDVNIAGINFYNANDRLARLTVRRSGANNSGRFAFNTTNAGTETEKMTILPTGNVGIGTASPDADSPLHIATSGGSSQRVRIAGSNSSALPQFAVFNNSNLQLSMGMLGSTVATSNLLIQNNAFIYSNSTGIGISVDNANGVLRFGTGTGGVERLRIASDGNVGIGTSSPARLLSLVTSTNADGLQIRRNSNTVNDYATLGFRVVATDSTFNQAELRTIRTNRAVAVDSDLAFLTYSNGAIGERLRIRDDGNVGIGTSSPATTLSVVAANNDGITIRRNSSSTNSNTWLGFRFSTGDASSNTAEVRAIKTDRAVANDTDLVLQTVTNNVLGERLRIRDDGLVGINETSPTAQLHVKSGATNRVPLIVDTVASGHTATIAEFSANGSVQSSLSRFGGFSGSSVSNRTNSNNSLISLSTTGTTISRNVADTNPALIVDLANASATGNIQVWQKAGSALSQISNAGIFVGQSRPTRTDITANATLALADEGKVLRVNSSSNLTVTIPKNSAVAFPIDTEIAILRYGTGTVSIAPVDGDVTLQSKNAERKISDRYGSVALKKIGENEWVLVGSLEA